MFKMTDIDVKNLTLGEKIDFVKENIDGHDFKFLNYYWKENLSKKAKVISASSILDSESLALKLSCHLNKCTIENAKGAFDNFLEEVKGSSENWNRFIFRFDDRTIRDDCYADEYAVEICLNMMETEEEIQNRISLWEKRLNDEIQFFLEKEKNKEEKELETLRKLQEKYCKKS